MTTWSQWQEAIPCCPAASQVRDLGEKQGPISWACHILVLQLPAPKLLLPSDLNPQGCSCVPLLSNSPNQFSIHSQTAQQPDIALQCFRPQGTVRRSIRRFIIALYLGPCTLCACKALYKTPLLAAQRAAGTRSCFRGAVCIPPAGFRESPTSHIACQQTSPEKMANSSLSEGAGSTQEQLSFGAQPPPSAASSLTKQNSEVHLKSPRAAGGAATAHCSLTSPQSRPRGAVPHQSPSCGRTGRSPTRRRCPRIAAGRTRCSCGEGQEHGSAGRKQQSCLLTPTHQQGC